MVADSEIQNQETLQSDTKAFTNINTYLSIHNDKQPNEFSRTNNSDLQSSLFNKNSLKRLKQDTSLNPKQITKNLSQTIDSKSRPRSNTFETRDIQKVLLN